MQAFLLALPATGERLLPIRVRAALGLALTPLFAAAAPTAVPDDLLSIAALMAAEIVTGLVMGLMVRVVAMALDIGSTALAQSASLSALLGMSEDMPPHPIGNLMHLAGLAVLMALGLPVLICQFLADSFRMMAPGSWPEIGTLWPAFGALVRHGFVLAVDECYSELWDQAPPAGAERWRGIPSCPRDRITGGQYNRCLYEATRTSEQAMEAALSHAFSVIEARGDLQGNQRNRRGHAPRRASNATRP